MIFVASKHWQLMQEKVHVLQEVKISLYIARNFYSRRFWVVYICKTYKHLSLTPWDNFYIFRNDLYSIKERIWWSLPKTEQHHLELYIYRILRRSRIFKWTYHINSFEGFRSYYVKKCCFFIIITYEQVRSSF